MFTKPSDNLPHDYAGYCVSRLRDPHRLVDWMAHLAWHTRGGHEIAGDIPEQALQVHLLPMMAAYGGSRLLAHDGHDRHVVHRRVLQAIQQVDGARPADGITRPHFPGELRKARRHERRHLVVANLPTGQPVPGGL